MTMRDTQPMVMENEALQALGSGQIAYVRSMTSDDLLTLFPEVPELESGLHLWVLLNADGTPIMLADSREAVLANAAEQHLQTVWLH